MQLRAVIYAVGLVLVAGCGGGDSSTATRRTDSAVFLPLSSGGTGLFVLSSKSPGDPPKQITTSTVYSLGLQAKYNLSAQGTASAVSPYAFMYTTFQSPSGDHVWSLNLSDDSSLVPTQLSNLSLPGILTHYGPGANSYGYCTSEVIPTNLADPSSAILILSLPTTETYGCLDTTTVKWVLIHSSDGPTTNPVDLPSLSGPILPLYRPDGTLSGLVTADSSNNLNFYQDETFANPRLLLQNVFDFVPKQEPRTGGEISWISANPTYSFLLVRTSASGPTAVYRIDYSGSISADLHDFHSAYGWGLAADAGSLYFTETTANPSNYVETVGRIPGDGSPVELLGSTSAPQSYQLSALVGVSGSNLVFFGGTPQQGTPQQQWQVQTLPKDAPGAFTTIASNASLPNVTLLSGDIFVTWLDLTPGSSEYKVSTEILDSAGTVLQDSMSSSLFASERAPIIQLKNVTDSLHLGGAAVYALDLSQPLSPTAVAFKKSDGSAFTLPNGADSTFFRAVTSTVGVSDGAPALVYDLDKKLIVAVSAPHPTQQFLTDAGLPWD
jgi:hypothetical protein